MNLALPVKVVLHMKLRLLFPSSIQIKSDQNLTFIRYHKRERQMHSFIKNNMVAFALMSQETILNFATEHKNGLKFFSK